MHFKHAQLYRMPTDWGMTAERLGAQLSRLTFRPCGSQDHMTVGWVPRKADGPLVHNVHGQWLITLQTEERILPSSVVNQVTAERVEEIEEQQGYKPGRRQMKEIKEAVIQELLPRAFVRHSRMSAWIDPVAGWLVVDASSRNAADKVVECLHKSVDDLPLKLLNTRRTPVACMTEWLVANEAPGALTIDQDCELRAETEEKSTVRYAHHSLEGKDVREHIEAGKKATKLALTYNDRVSFLLTDRLEIKRLQFLDVLFENATTADNADEQFDADFVLTSSELRNLIAETVEALGGEENPNAGDLVEQAQEQDDSVLYEKAKAIVLETKRPSISLVQRHLRIGYNRAARLLDQLEADGVVSSMKSDGTREILVQGAEA